MTENLSQSLLLCDIITTFTAKRFIQGTKEDVSFYGKSYYKIIHQNGKS